MSKKKEGKRGRKIGRNKKWCEAYRRAGREEINRRKRMAGHCRRHPADREAHKALDRLENARYG